MEETSYEGLYHDGTERRTLQSRILVLEHLQLASLRHVHAGISHLLLVERRTDNTVLAAHIRLLRPKFFPLCQAPRSVCVSDDHQRTFGEYHARNDLTKAISGSGQQNLAVKSLADVCYPLNKRTGDVTFSKPSRSTILHTRHGRCGDRDNGRLGDQ